MVIVRFITVTAIILTAIILHELNSANLFSSFPFLASEIGWWLIGFFLITYIVAIEKKSLLSVGIRNFSRSTFSTAAIGFLLALLGVAAFGLITQFTGIDPAGTEEQLNQTATAPWWPLFFFFLRVGIIEELIFRGFVISRAIDFGASRGFVLLISSLLFTLPHALFWPAPHLILVAFSGLAFGTIFIWKRDLSACVLAHVGFNVAGVMVASLA